MSKTVLCVKKGLREITRKKRTVVFNVLIFAVSIMQENKISGTG